MKLVLIVEDEYGHAEILRLLLEEEGYRVELASNGKAALAAVAAEVPDVVVTDFMMPYLTGGELGVALRSDARWRHVPIVIQSGTIEDVVRRAFDDYDLFLRKPLDIDELLAAVARFATQGRAAA